MAEVIDDTEMTEVAEMTGVVENGRAVRPVDAEGNGKEVGRRARINDEDTQCGFWMLRGAWMQRLANKKILVLLFGLTGCIYSSMGSYFNGTITTMEKRFRIPSRTTGVISVGNDITQLFASVILNYYASRGHRPRWIAFGLYCVVAFCFLNALPHFLYGPGEDALQLTFEYGADFANNSRSNSANSNLCSVKEHEECISEKGNVTTVVILFISQLISGVGGVVFFSLGYSYLDDNIKKSKSPVFISFTYFMRMLGPALGSVIVSICVKIYIAPNLTPTIDNLDPRWLGAWWIGWIMLGITLAVLATFLCLLPKTLPRAAARKELYLQRCNAQEEIVKVSLSDMMVTVKRLLTNKVYVYNQVVGIFYVFGYIPYWIFLPKYIETIYRKSASVASLVTGSIGLGFSALGILIAGLAIQIFKPKAKFMAWWNMFIDLITTFGIISYAFIGCPEVDKMLPTVSNGELNTTLSCNANCMCDFVKFSPVCSMDGRTQTFISACHAGCTEQNTLDNGTIIYSNCSCIKPIGDHEAYGSAMSGPCPVDCQQQFFTFVAIVCVLKFIGSLSRVTNFLVSVRCVEERDKTVSLGITVAAISCFSLIPAPIFFGYLIDSTCLVWGKTCSGTGNCWFFNAELMRNKIVFISSIFLFIAVFFDVVIWWIVKDMNMFGEDEAVASAECPTNPPTAEDIGAKGPPHKRLLAGGRRDSEASHIMIQKL